MDRLHDHHQSYSWHQSHDQATVLLLLPYDTAEDDVAVIIEEDYLVAGAHGQPPLVKGKLYSKANTSASVWQLEPRTSRLSQRERTTSTLSATSTQSSYAFVSEPEISSSFAASLEAGLVSGSDVDDAVLSSPALSSPISTSTDEHIHIGPPYDPRHQRRSRASVSPPARQSHRISQASSYSSLESLHSGAGRLLTIHLEKAESVIWPSLIVGPVPESVSPTQSNMYPWTTSVTEEAKYNMDPTSLALIALDLHDIRKSKEDAFEYFIRAWHQAHLPSAAIRLATHYLPLRTLVAEASDAAPDSPTSSVVTVSAKASRSAPAVQPLTPSSAPSTSALQLTSVPPPPEPPSLTVPPGTEEYYLSRLGGAHGLAQLFLAAGLLHLEGTAPALLASSYAGLSALRAPFAGPASLTTSAGSSAGGVDAWRRDREHAARFFQRARTLNPALDVPLLPADPESEYNSGAESGAGDAHAHLRDRSRSPASSPLRPAETRPRRRGERHARTAAGGTQLEMPTLDVRRGAPPTEAPLPQIPSVRRRRPRVLRGPAADGEDGDLSSSMIESVHADPDLGPSGEDDRTWYLYVPGLVGAGTALLVVGLLSLQSWRKNQG
ncbi:uncharacterized protein TRAVEDRAFT_29444 [Trametes versicolor FP-101664 SS1]|uniref:uncharacterized protein n=1 Tax=Trametes versicolor (strain FP-101664) TaxID=717944 RepID=UPI0004623640|nr:uncharacterized protein TRAVEDRAFT_29444 [Trametes versicolor FP-101664 SS1]EIW57311.1 hypothetical protein TRAVEDRAFT_29444 [Trametes versicolor FP-101664 SS1]